MFIKSKIKAIPKSIWILFLIIILGIFLRAYNFHSWMDFEKDQVRDARLVDSAANGKSPWPLLGPDMTGSRVSYNKIFHLGPLYYYLEIISAKIFGSSAQSLAYPTLFFAILSLPLFYIFSRRYFSTKLSLVLTGLYSISYYSIIYSRFAWNSNLIPFFSLLILLALHEFLIKKEKVHWIWDVFLGIAIGVGFQLHAILMMLFPALAFFIFLYLLIRKKIRWKNMALVLLIFMALNIGQIISETKTNFSNTKIFFQNFSGQKGRLSDAKGSSLLLNLGKNIDCQIEANSYLTTSLDNNSCTFYYFNFFGYKGDKTFFKAAASENSRFWIFSVTGLIFFILGCFLLIAKSIREKEEGRKYFLWLVAIYFILSIFIMHFAINIGFLEFRYFIQSFFLPLFFLGWILEWLAKRISHMTMPIAALIFLAVAASNIHSILTRSEILAAKKGSDSHFIILGEAESISEYIIDNSGSQKEAQLFGNQIYLSNFITPLQYLAEKKDFNLIQISRAPKIDQDKPLFYIQENKPNYYGPQIGGYKIQSRRDFGQISLYYLEKTISSQ